MNTEHNVEHVLQRWLVDGIDEMPERVYLSILDRVERQPQHRAWRVSWRDSTVNTYFKPLLAVAAIVAIAVAGFAVLRPSGDAVAPPVGASPTPLPPLLPDGPLDHRDYTGRALVGDPMAFVITAPEGWTGFGGFFMAGPNRSGAPGGIGISFNHDPQVVAVPCGAHDEDPAMDALSVDDLVAALSARDDLQITDVTETTLAGYPGKRLDLEFGGEPGCGSPYVFAEPKGLYSNGPGNRWRMWLLDVEGETAVVVLLDYAATPAEDRAAAEAAIESIRIIP